MSLHLSYPLPIIPRRNGFRTKSQPPAAKSVVSCSAINRYSAGCKRQYTSVMIVPTGVGAAIGGYAGDALPVARALASVVDCLITHPNVLNAAMLYWPMSNVLYVEGYALDRFAEGSWALQPVHQNRVGLVLDAGMEEELRIRHLQVADAARASLGLPVMEYVVTETPLMVEKWIDPKTGQSTGRIRHPASLLRAVQALMKRSKVNAVAVVGRFPDDDVEETDNYRQGMGVDTLAGVEAIISHLVVKEFQIPCAHAPALSPTPICKSLSPKSAAEELGYTFLPCVLSGLSYAPQYLSNSSESLGKDCILANDVDSVIVPIDACGGDGALAFARSKHYKPLIIAVEENETVLSDSPESLGIEAVKVSNYWEAIGFQVPLNDSTEDLLDSQSSIHILLLLTSEVVGDDRRRALALQLLDLVRDFVLMSGRSITGAGDVMKKDCTDLIRRIALLIHLAEEITNFCGGFRDKFEALTDSIASSSSCLDCLSEVVGAIQAAKRLLYTAMTFSVYDDDEISPTSTEGGTKKLVLQFHYVTTRLETALSNLPFDHFCVADEVQEQVDLVRAQLMRASKNYESMSDPIHKKLEATGSVKAMIFHDVKTMSSVDDGDPDSQHRPPNRDDLICFDSDELKNSNSCFNECSSVHSEMEDVLSIKSQDEVGKLDVIEIPENFFCPISLELMIDPVIISTGQTYERSNIQKWIDRGNTTCPKTQEQLQSLILTPNFAMRNLISEWCGEHNVNLEKGLTNRKLKKYRSFEDGCRRTLPIKTLVRHLSLGSVQEQKAAVTEIRQLSKSSSDHRVEIAKAGAIPQLVVLLTSEDVATQENAISCILNLSLHEPNKRLIMLHGAFSYISQVLKFGSMEGRECAAGTIYSLSLADENKAIIGASGVIPDLIEILQIGSPRGQKDAAGALLNLCMYQGNKGRAFRAGIVKLLLKMLSDSNGTLVDDALYIMSVLCSHPEAKAAMGNANSLLVLTNVLKKGSSRSRENAVAVLLALCKGDWEKLEWLTRLGAAVPLMKLSKDGTERAKRKAASLLDQLRKS
ncbi:U-box domain-containing protein 11, partial [Cucurbita argyrosperma subsp. sororia]